MTLRDPKIPLVFSLHYFQQGCHDWEEEVPPENMGPTKKQEKERGTFTLRRILLKNWRA